MISKRIARINELIQQELSKILQEHFEANKALVTVSYIKTAPDLKTAKAFISIFPFSKAMQTLEELKNIMPKLQQILNQTIELKYIPKIELYLDESQEYEDRIESLIKKIKDSKIDR